jgi:hypothetical protein
VAAGGRRDCRGRAEPRCAGARGKGAAALVVAAHGLRGPRRAGAGAQAARVVQQQDAQADSRRGGARGGTRGRRGAHVKYAQEGAPAVRLLLGDGVRRKVHGRARAGVTRGRVTRALAAGGARAHWDDGCARFGVGSWSASLGRIAGCDTAAEEGAQAEKMRARVVCKIYRSAEA